MKQVRHSFTVVFWLIILASCQVQKQGFRRGKFEYHRFKASLVRTPVFAYDTTNVMEANDFTAGTDSVMALFRTIDSVWRREKVGLENVRPADKPEKKMIRADLAVVNKNIRSVASYLKDKGVVKKSSCREKDCPLVAEVVKSRQIMYLYISGDLKDSFAVSTGIPSRETPNMNVRPTGPLFIKYTSTKYPEGNYRGLGNMPYAVFVKGGYAIHGTTQGNFAKLGRKASHGCIRLHPDNAKLFYELVNIIGLNNTWVIVR